MHAHDKVSLLIVEDDANLRYLLEAAAARTNLFEPIRVTTDGARALELLRSLPPAERPAIVVTDLSMPRMTGLDLIIALKGDPSLRTIPIAVITSSDVPNDREKALAAGACLFLEKPYGLDELMALLRGIRDSCVSATVGAA